MTEHITDHPTHHPAARTTSPTAHDGSRSTALLQAWSLGVIAFGLAIVVVPWVRNDWFSWVARADSDLTAAFSQDARDYLTFNQTLIGALTAGVGLSAFWLARIPIARRESWGWIAFTSTIGLWFVVDNLASWMTGFPRNVVLNTVLVAPLAPMLWAARPGR